MATSTHADDVDDASLPYCADCGGRDWQLDRAIRDGRRTIRLFRCAACGAIGGRRERDGDPAIHYDGAMDS